MLDSVLDTKTAKILPWIIAVAFFMQMLDSTVLNTALPSMAVDFKTSPIQMQSVVIAYVLTVAFMIPASGWIAEKFGMKRIFLMAIILFTVSSVGCGVSTSLPIMIIGRICQGIGGALMVPVGRLIALKAYPRKQFVDVLSFITMPGLIGPLIGPTLGGVLVEYMSWHWIFFINLPVGLIGIFATWRYMPTFSQNHLPMNFDLFGFLILGIFMVSVTFGLEGMGELHFPIMLIVLLLGIGFFCLMVYVHYAKNRVGAIFPLDLYEVHNFRIGILGNIFARLGNGAMPFLIPLLLQIGLSFSPLESGLAMVPMTVGALIAKSIVTRSVHRLGFKAVLIANTMLLGIIIACFCLINQKMDYWIMLSLFFIFGIFNSVQFTAMNSVTLIDLSQIQASSGNSLFSAIQQLSLGMSIAVGTSVFDYFIGSTFHPTKNEILHALSWTYICLGIIVFISSILFMRLKESTTD